MEPALKQRLVGAVVLIALAVIFLPMLLDGSGEPERLDFEVEIPERSAPPEPMFEEPELAAEPAASEPAASEPAAEPEAAEAGSVEPAVTGWAIQVGSFTREANALVLRDRLRSQGYTAFVEQGEADGDPVWRVRVGPMAREAEARETAAELESERGKPVLVTTYP